MNLPAIFRTDSYGEARRAAVALHAGLCLVPLLVALPRTALARVEVNVDRIGYPTLRSGNVVRNGIWTPVRVTIDLVDQPAFDGSVRIAQFDNDGDECYDLVDVHLRAETGGSRELDLFALANPDRGQSRFFVEVFDDNGEAVQVVSQGVLTYRASPAQQPVVIDDNDLLLVSVSNGPIGRLKELTDPQHRDLYRRRVHIGHIGPAGVPQLWHGLEMVDFVLWDDARPEDLSKRQLEALLNWVRQGGNLMITASRSANAIELTPELKAVLPVELGEPVVTKNLPDERYALLGPPTTVDRKKAGDLFWHLTPFPKPVQVTQCTLREGARPVPPTRDNQSTVFTRGRLGRGHVIFGAVVLADFFSGEGKPTEFFEHMCGLMRLSEEEQAGRPHLVSLFDRVVSAVSFSTRASVYLFVAGASSVLYVLLATFGTWGFLKARQWTRHSWSVFSIVAVAASLLSAVAVNARQGIGETLHQLSVVDTDSDTALGYATCLFGLKTSSDRLLDVWLPQDPLGATSPGPTVNSLRPTPAANELGETTSTFVDPVDYRLQPGSAVLEGLRIRATLKLLEGRWVGGLGGKVTGDITIRGRRITNDSYIANDLGVDLYDCWLLQPRLDIDLVNLRGDAIYAYPIGNLPADRSHIVLADRMRPKSGETMRDYLSRSTLANAQGAWSKLCGDMIDKIGIDSAGVESSLDQVQAALMLLSTIGEFDETRFSRMSGLFGRSSWSRDRLRRLDLRRQLDTRSVILIGFTRDAAGPARLYIREGERNYRPLEPDPDASTAMYRVRIPATRIGPLPADDKDEETDDEDNVLGIDISR